MKRKFWNILRVCLGVILGLSITPLTFADEAGNSTEAMWKLPAPKKKSKISLEEALSLRRSSKQGFTNKPLTEEEIGQILWAGRGVNRPEGKLTSPSAMARYSVSVYVATDKGTFIYIPENHSLSPIDTKDIRRGIGTQEHMQTAPVILIFVADFSKLPEDFPMQRKISFVCAEAGTIGENVYLQCATLKLGTCFVASVDKDFVSTALNFGKDVEALFAMPVGHPK